MQSSEPVPPTKADERRKFAAWRNKLDVYLGTGASSFHPTRSGSRRKRWKPFDLPQQELSITARFNFPAHASRTHGAIENRA
jgi:hypothetical protein